MSIQLENNFCFPSNTVWIGSILVVLCKTLEVCKNSMQRESKEDHVKTKQGNHGLRCFSFTRTPGCFGHVTTSTTYPWPSLVSLNYCFANFTEAHYCNKTGDVIFIGDIPK